MGHLLLNGSYVWSKYYKFKSSPYPGHDSLQRIVIFGDMGKAEHDGSNDYSDYQPASLNMTDQLFRDYNIDIVFHVGDLSYANGYLSQSQWAQMDTYRSGISLRLKVSGNHERGWPNMGSFYSKTDSGGECGLVDETMFYVPADSIAKFWLVP